MNKSIIGAGVLALALSLTACGGGNGGGAAPGRDDPAAAAAALGGADAVAEFDTLYAAATDAGEKEVVVYTPLTSQYGGVFDTFKKRFPEITVNPLQIVGAELDTRINQEQTSGQYRADTVITGDTGAVKLSQEGNLTPYEAFNAGQVYADPANSLDDKTLTAIAASQRGVVYDSRQDLGVEITGWGDLTDPALKGKMAITDPTTDGGGLQWADLVLNDEGLGRPYLEQLATQDLQMVATTAECHNTVTQGRAALCISGELGTYLTLKEKGAPLEYIYPMDDGNIATYFYSGVIKNAPHENASKLLIAWLNTPEANDAAAEVGQAPVVGETTVASDFPSLSEVQSIPRPPLAEVGQRQQETLKVTQEIFG